MVLAFHTCLAEIDDALGGSLPGTQDAARLVNQVGQYVFSMYPWKFLERPEARLDIRGKVTFTAATWTESSLGLAITAPASALATYTFLAGDRLEVTSGTGAKASTYGIASISSNTPTLKETISTTTSSADGQTNIAGSVLPVSACALPSDFSSIIALTGTNGLQDGIRLTDLSTINAMRTNGIDIGSWVYCAAIAYGAASAPGGPPVPRLEIYSSSTANDAGAFTLLYRAGWPPILAEGSAGLTEQILPVPEWLEFPFLQMVRAFAYGVTEDDDRPMVQRIGEVLPLFEHAKERDGAVQTSYGHSRGGIITQYWRQFPDNFLRTTVADPA